MTAQDVARRLPDIPVVRDRSRSLAMLDAILSPEWEYRYYSFNAAWGPARELASMRNGTGDDYAIVFSPAGAWIRVFDHESPMSPWALEPPRPWPGVLDTVPAVFQACVQEPAFILDGVLMVSACLWRQATDDRWQTGVIDFPAGRGTRTAARGCWSCCWTTPQGPIGGSPRTITSLRRWTWRPCGRCMRCGR